MLIRSLANPMLRLGRAGAVGLVAALLSTAPLALAQEAAPESAPAETTAAPTENSMAPEGAAPRGSAAGDAHDVAEGVAQETAEHVEGGLPQLNAATYPTQLFWLAVTFGTLLVLMSKVALPRVGEVLEARQEKIASDLDKAGAFKAESDAVIAAYEKALAEARSGAQKLMAEAAVAGDAVSSRRQADLAAELASRSKEAESRIEAAKQAALVNVRAVAADAARAAVAKLSGVDLDAGAVDMAVENALKERA